jgi:hypothetical protein
MNLLPQFTQQKALELRYSKALMKLDKGLGEKTAAIAHEFADSGLSPTIAGMLMQTVYAPTQPDGRGQATRVKWFMETVRRRYMDRLDKARNNITFLRTILSEMEEITLMRDTLCGEGASITFEQTFHLYELGYDAEAILGIIADLDTPTKGAGIWRINRAVAAVKSGRAYSLESALDFT